MTMLRVGEGTLDEGGYTRIVGNTTFESHGKDMSTHPNVRVYIPSIKDYSRAAGAYQITSTNWNGPAFKKWRTDKKITDFSEVSQDKYCLYLLKEKKKAIDLISKGYISEAIRMCRKEWASLPGSDSGQREEKMQNVINHYIDFFQKEISGETKLHITNEELNKIIGKLTCKEDFYDNFGENKIIDLRNKIVFFDQGAGNTNCNKTCKAILEQINLFSEGATVLSKKHPLRYGSYYQLAEENTDLNSLEYYNDGFVKGVEFLDKSLEKGEPVMVGVHHTYNYKPKIWSKALKKRVPGNKINEYTTDHYVIIIGRNYLNGKIVYPYLDVGTFKGGQGDYYFTLESDKLTSTSREKSYTLTQIRRNGYTKK